MTDYTIRTVAKDDLDALVDLHLATYGARDNSMADVRAFHERLLEHVLCDGRPGSPAVHSLVSVHRDEIVAMVYGAHSPLLLNARRVWATTGTLLAIHPDHRVRECTQPFLEETSRGTGDLFIADRSNAQARRTTMRQEGVGCYPQYSLRWGRVVRPATGALGGALNRSQRFSPRATRVLRRVTRAVDTAVDRSRPTVTAIDATKAASRLTTSPLTAEQLAQHGESILKDFTLRPDTTSVEMTELSWSRFRALRPEGTLERVGAWTSDGELAGWYVLHALPTGTGEVVQMIAGPESQADLVSLLLQHAKDLGLGSVHGTASSSMLIALSEAGAYYHGRNAAFLMRTKRKEIHDAFASATALVTGMESEYPMMLASTNALVEALKPI